MVTVPCSVHPEEKAITYCLQCDCHQNACLKCILVNGKHSNHTFGELEEGLQMQVAALEKLLETTERTRLGATDSFKKQVDFKEQVKQELLPSLEKFAKTVDKLISDLLEIKVDVHTAVLQAAQTAQAQAQRGTDYAKLVLAVRLATKWAGQVRNSLKGAGLSTLSDLLDQAPDRRDKATKLQEAMQVAKADFDSITVKSSVDLKVKDGLNLLRDRVGSMLKLSYGLDWQKDSAQTLQKHLLIFAGGYNSTTSTAYDTSRNTWRRVAPLSCARNGVAAALWQGKMVVAGGWNGYGNLDLVEQFNPETNSWTALPSLLQRRSWLALASFEQSLFAIGGTDGPYNLNSVERYTNDTQQWQRAASLNTPRERICCGVLQVGILVAGGHDGTRTLETCELYNNSTQTWQFAGSLVTARSAASAATLNERMFIFGGYDGRNRLCSVEMYINETNEWTLLRVRLRCRRDQMAAATVNGRIYICGGLNNNLNECFDSCRMRIDRVASPTHLWGAAAVSVPVTEEFNKQLLKMTGGTLMI